MKFMDTLTTQRNYGTSDPLYCVMEKRRLYHGYDGSYDDDENYMWVDFSNDGCEADEEETAKLDELEDESFCMSEEDSNFFHQWTKVGYTDIDVFVTVCFTERGAQEYIDRYHYNHNKPFIYVTSCYRNEEMKDIRKHLISLTNTESSVDYVI